MKRHLIYRSLWARAKSIRIWRITRAEAAKKCARLAQSTGAPAVSRAKASFTSAEGCSKCPLKFTRHVNLSEAVKLGVHDGSQAVKGNPVAIAGLEPNGQVSRRRLLEVHQKVLA